MNKIEQTRQELETILKKVCQDIGPITIGSATLFPYGWRKAAKGRTVWRIVEEIIAQRLEYYQAQYNIQELHAANSEVGVFDFHGKLNSCPTTHFFVNIKSAVSGAKTTKDDISKADKLLTFLQESQKSDSLFVATFIINFDTNFTISITDCLVMPIEWVPDIYVNPSNNGNLQSAKCKAPNSWIHRSKEDFILLLSDEIQVAIQKKQKKTM